MATERKKKYGLGFPAHWSQLDQELWCFKTGRTQEQGGLGKAGHFWRVVAILWGKTNAVGNKTKYFIRNPWSEEMIDAACEHRYIGVGGPGYCSKSETYALWLLVSYLADPRNTLGVVISTSLKEARRRMWGSLVDFIRAVPALPLKIVDSQGLIRYDSPTFQASDKSSICLVAAERKQEKEAVGKLIGMHNENVIVVADELSELTDSILEYALPGGNLPTNPRYQFVGLANPYSYYDPFARLWKPKAGWMSVTVDSERWLTEYGVGIHFDAFKSPNVLSGKLMYPFLPTMEKIRDAQKTEGGENSVRFWRMMRGFMCPTGREDYIYSEIDILTNQGDIPAIWGDLPISKVAALDPGFTNGGDRSIAYFGSIGLTKSAVRTLCYDEYVELVEDVTLEVDGKKIERAYQIAGQFKAECEKRGIPPQAAAVDETGAGGPFCDVVATVWSPQILRVNFSGKASDLPVSLSDPKPANERYYDRVTEIWYSGKELLRQGQIKGLSTPMIREMTARKYGTTGADKKIYAESKKDMKFRTGGVSPDIADAGFILVTLARERFNFVVAIAKNQQQGMATSSRDWRGLCNRLSAETNRARGLARRKYPLS